MEAEHARTIAKETVAETFLALGVDMRSPDEVREMQQDFAFMRYSRTLVYNSTRSAIIALVVMAASGLGVAVWHLISSAKAG